MGLNDDKANKRLLALDTSTAALTVAVTDEAGTRAFGEISSHSERNHSMHLVPTVKRLLAELDMTPSDIGGIIVGRGPGSYTGVRIGITVAKTLAWAWSKPIVGVSSLEALALGGLRQSAAEHDEAEQGASEAAEANMLRNVPMLAPEQPFSAWNGEGAGVDWVIPLMDARRGQVYTALFAGAGAGLHWHRCAPDGIRLMRDWTDAVAARLEAYIGDDRSHKLGAGFDSNGADGKIARQDAAAFGLPPFPGSVPDVKPARVWFVGDIELHLTEAKRLQERFGELIRIMPAHMQARWIGRIGAGPYAAGDFADVHRLEPNYTQLAEAEAKLLAKS